MPVLVPRPYQQEGIDWFLEKRRAANYDKPGLGKSLQAAIAASKYLPCLISCPSYLLWQWHDFLNEQFPGVAVSLAEGDRLSRAVALNQPRQDFYLINHDMFRTFKSLPRCTTLIIDEAHHMSGRNALRAVNAQKYAAQVPYVYELTATPIRRTSDALYQQLRILDPYRFSSYYRFIDEYCSVTHRGFTPIVRGTKRPKALAELLSHYAIGRDYADVGIQVPGVIYSNLLVDFNSATRHRYDVIKKKYRDPETEHLFGTAAEKIRALRQLTLCKEKVQAVKGLIDDISSRDTGFILYTYYIDSAKWWAEQLGNIPYITSETPANQRLPLAKRSKALVCTLGALAEGGDLTHLKNQIYVELNYMAGDLTQTVGRSNRPTWDKAPVMVYFVMMKKSIDETIYKVSMNRVHDAEQVLQQELL